MKTRLPTREQVEACQTDRYWDPGNEVLYKLCRENFEHKEDDKILAKVWLIGRSCRRSRGRKNKKDGECTDSFYVKFTLKCLELKSENLQTVQSGLRQQTHRQSTYKTRGRRARRLTTRIR